MVSTKSFFADSASSAVEQSASGLDVGRLRRETFIAEVEYHAELDSTNSRAIALAAEGAAATPLLVFAQRQTAGRGRGSNAWWSTSGSLTFSLLLDGTSLGVPIDRWPMVSLAAALAVRQSVAEHVPQREVRVKWPNDVFLAGKKVAGILVEMPPVRPQKLVLGIGLNVNNSLATAPAEVRSVATSLIDELSRDETANCKLQNANCYLSDSSEDSEVQSDPFPISDSRFPISDFQFPISNLQSPICNFSLSDVLLHLLQALEIELASLRQDPTRLAARWRPHCLLSGRIVKITSGDQAHVGLCQSIDETGAILLETESGPKRLLSGVVSRLE